MNDHESDTQQALETLGVTLPKLAVRQASEILDHIMPQLEVTDDITEILDIFRAAVLTAGAVPALVAYTFYDAMQKSAKDPLSPTQMHQLQTIVRQLTIAGVEELFQTLAQRGSSVQIHH